MIYAVIDTNVFVASFLSKHDDSATIRLMRAMGNGKFTPLFSEEILEEYREVLLRSKFKISPDVVEALIDKIRNLGELASGVQSDEKFPDEDDRVFYEVALSHADQNAKLVTGNLRHFPRKPFVVTPSEFCQLIGV